MHLCRSTRAHPACGLKRCAMHSIWNAHTNHSWFVARASVCMVHSSSISASVHARTRPTVVVVVVVVLASVTVTTLTDLTHPTIRELQSLRTLVASSNIQTTTH